MFAGFRAVCEHSEFVFSTGILYLFVAFELFAGMLNSHVRFGSKGKSVFLICRWHSTFALGHEGTLLFGRFAAAQNWRFRCWSNAILAILALCRNVKSAFLALCNSSTAGRAFTANPV